MASTRRSSDDNKKPRRPPAKTPQDRENQLIDLAVDLAEKQLRDGSASSQVMSLYLKLGSTREELEQERLRNENELLRKEIEGLESAIQVERLMEDALNAFRGYSGQGPEEAFDD